MGHARLAQVLGELYASADGASMKNAWFANVGSGPTSASASAGQSVARDRRTIYRCGLGFMPGPFPRECQMSARRIPRAAGKSVSTPFLSDVETLRKRARQHIDEGAVTPNYGAHAGQVCKVLNDALATEIVCVLRYKRHYFMAQGMT